MKKIIISLIFVFLLYFSFNVNAIAVVIPNSNSTTLDNQYILGTSLLLFDQLPYMTLALPHIFSKVLTGTSIVDSIYGKNTPGAISGVPVMLSDAEVEIVESVSPYLQDTYVNISKSRLDNGEDSFMLSYYESKKNSLNNIILMFNYIISLFIIIKEIIAVLVQLMVFSVAVLIFISLLPNLFVYIKELYREQLYKNVRKLKR